MRAWLRVARFGKERSRDLETLGSDGPEDMRLLKESSRLRGTRARTNCFNNRCGRGIGLEIAQFLRNLGYRVIGTSTNSGGVQLIDQALGPGEKV